MNSSLIIKMVYRMRNFIFLVFFVHYASAETFRTAVSVDGVNVNQDVELDRKGKFMIVNVGKISHRTGDGCKGVSTINLHDFGQGMLAMKNIDNGECIITADIENYEAALKLLEESNRYHIAHALTKGVSLKRIPITEKQAAEFGGDRIAEFCKGYKTYRGKEIPEDKSVSRKRAKKGCWGWWSSCHSCLYNVY